MFEFLSFLYLVFLPLFYIGGPNGVREYIAITISAIVWIGLLAYSLFGNSPGLPIAATLFGAWLILSLAWSKSKDQSIFDCLMLLSCLTCFYVVRQIPLETALLLCFMPAPGMAVIGLSQEIDSRRQDITHRPGGIFGNCNHHGVYLVLNVFIGLWLAFNISLWIMPFVLVVIAGAILSRSRNAQLSLILGTNALAFFLGEWGWGIAMWPFFIIPLCMMKWHPSLRDVIFKKTLILIRGNYLYGRGLNTFRSEHNFISPPVQTHRVHNDLLEFWNDIGLIGLILIGGIYYSVNWGLSSLLSTQLVVGLVTAMFFFTFREIHTAMPVFCLLGVLTPDSSIKVLPCLAFLLMIVLPYMLWLYVGKKVIGLYWYAKGSHQKNKEAQYMMCLKAIEKDPNGEYLSRGASLASRNHESFMAWDLTCKALYNFDGTMVLYSLYHQVSQAALAMGSVAIADFYNKRCLEVLPDFEAGLKMSEKIESIKEKIRGNHAVQVRS